MSHRTTARGAFVLFVLVSETSLGAPPALTLQDAYARARDRSPEVRLLHLRIRQAEANVDRAWALLKPQWTAGYNFTHIEPPPPQIAFPDLTNPDLVEKCQQGSNDPVGCIEALQASLSEPILLDFAQRDTHSVTSRIIWNPINPRAVPTITNAYEAVDLERERTEVQQTELLLAVARSYYAAFATKSSIAAAERAQARAKAQLEEIRARAELGERARTILQGAESAARQADLDFRRALNAHAQTMLALWQLTHSGDRPDIVAPPIPEVPPGDQSTLVQAAKQRRKDVAAATRSVEIAQRAEDEVWWRLAPVVGVFGGYRYSNVQGITGQNSQWSVGVNATLQLYDGGVRYGDLRAAQSRVASSVETRRSLLHRIEGEIARALLALEGSDLAVAQAEEAIKMATEAHTTNQARFEVGAATTSDINLSQDRLLDAEFALIRAKTERSMTILELRHAAGLFDPLP